MYNGNYKVASLVYIYNVYVCSKTIFSPVLKCRTFNLPFRTLLTYFRFRLKGVQSVHNFLTLLFLAHLSTKCSWWAIVVSGLSVVVRCASTFDVYTLKTTFVIRFLWNFVRMFVLTISRPSSNMGHVGLKTRSTGQILGNSCLHSKGHICGYICDLILMKLCQNVCLDNILYDVTSGNVNNNFWKLD